MTQTIVDGARALEATLGGMRESVRKRIMRSAVNRSLTIIAREIRKSVPKAKTPGHDMKRVKKSVGTRPYKAKRDHYSGKTGLRVGNRVLERDADGFASVTSSNVAPHAHWIPLGTNERRTKSGAYRGKVTPRPFVRSAASRAEPNALEEMRKRFKQQFVKEVEKERRKNRSKG